MDREKVIKGLESLRDICNAKSNMAIGEGKIAWAGYANTADDAISLLKEQEESIPVSWLTEKLEGHTELPYAVTDGITNVLYLWEGR